MNRKEFLKKSVFVGATIGVVPAAIANRNIVSPVHSTYDQLMDQVGFNHIPNNEMKTKNTVLHKADTRGFVDNGWMNSHHSFSFANYYNPNRMNFGVLRVLNDDVVAADSGFDTHPHDNMEIISIPLAGDLVHKDSMNNSTVIEHGDVQVMSAGTGIFHSEYNNSANKEVRFLQIWLFPNKRNVNPRYDQISIKDLSKPNEFYQVLSPKSDDQGVWIHQNAWFSLGEFDQNINCNYQLNDTTNGVYIFVLNGNIEILGQKLNKRDGFGIWDMDEINMFAEKGAKVLLMEVPMKV